VQPNVAVLMKKKKKAKTVLMYEQWKKLKGAEYATAL